MTAARRDCARHYGVQVSQEPDKHHAPIDEGGGPDPHHHDARDFEEHAQAHDKDMKDARETLDRVRREMPFRKALWGYRLYYIGVFASAGSLLVNCFDSGNSPMVVVPIALPLGVVGYIYGYIQLRTELLAYMADASPRIWHSRRDRKNLWQSAIFRDAFMGRLR